MKFCMDHWNRLRAAIEERGLSGLVHQGGTAVAEAQMREIQGTATDHDFDPLMSAHWAIANNAMKFAQDRYKANPLALMVTDPEHSERECPVCFLNWLHAEHDVACTQPGCDYPKGETYEWMLARAADDALAIAREKHLVPGTQ